MEAVTSVSRSIENCFGEAFASISSCFGEVFRSIILEPVRNGDIDVLLVFAPGANTSAEDYEPLCKEIQKLCQLRLWIAIINPRIRLLSPPVIDATIGSILPKIKKMGFHPGKLSTDNVFLAGHSLGAVSSTPVARHRAQGLILIGCSLADFPGNLSQYPIPVLSLAGDRDGQLTLGPIASSAGEIADDEKAMGSFNTYGRKPVVVVPGMNHAQASNGVPDKKRGDLDAEIPIEEARAITGAAVSAFVTLHVDRSNAAALRELEVAVKMTHSMCRAFWEAMDEQGGDVEKHQLELADRPSEVLGKDQIVVIHHKYQENFDYSNPWIELKPETKIFVHAFLIKAKDNNYGVVKNIAIKMKSKDGVAAVLDHDSSGNGRGVPSSNRIAATFNEKTFKEALELVPERARSKYLNKGRKLRFPDDVICDSLKTWNSSEITFVAADDGFTDVRSPLLVTPINKTPSSGTNYMKILTRASAMAWILQDCFREA